MMRRPISLLLLLIIGAIIPIESFKRSPAETVKFKISGEHLKDKDKTLGISGISDPLVEVLYKDDATEKSLGWTKTIMDDANPNFDKIFETTYEKDKHPKLVLKFYDWDPLANDVIGTATADLNAALASTDGVYRTELDTEGTAIVRIVDQPLSTTGSWKNVPDLSPTHKPATHKPKNKDWSLWER